jgi:uncharacterized protein (TIGR02246 family)
MQLFARYVHARDIDKLVGLYEPRAVFIPGDQQSARGHEEIRSAMRDMLTLKPRLHLVTLAVHRAGDIALVINQWQLLGTAAHGGAIELKGKSAVVLRRQPDGTWRLLIDRP